ncbi:hypothetical protein C5167_050112 [Papaver somniferum]|uniref:Uncharacterized protein n=1 Tax=Papaver somniferum TaxID=3469 RepID=A0A4Y7KQL5_PAPSO|nr:hypothetical protein C5167_050112 [Papaver somniferum]
MRFLKNDLMHIALGKAELDAGTQKKQAIKQVYKFLTSSVSIKQIKFYFPSKP